MSDILTGFNMQGNDPIDDRIVSKSNLETLEQYLNRVPVQKRYYGLTFFALDKNNELRKYTFQTSLIEPTIDDDKEEIERIDKELQEHVSNKAIHKTSEEIRSEIVDADIPDTIARVQWTLDQINTAVINLIGGASDEYNTLKRIQTKIEELRAKIYGDDGGTVLKTLEQALKFLNQYKDFIVDIPENFVNKQDIVDNLTTDDPTKVLSAKQGKVLSDTLTNYFESAMQSIRTETDRAINAENRIETKLDKEIDRSIKEDQRIDAKLDAEIKRSTDEDLRIDSKLDAEIERSTNEDIRIDNKLDSEINRSTAEDNRLDKKIDAETTRATTAESNLNTKIETETDRAEGEESRIETKLDNEITRSTNKDTEHDNRLQALEGQTHEQNTDLGTTNSTFQLKYNTGNKIKHESDAISVRNAADTDYVNFIAKNATFKGDLLVEGQSFVTEAETVEIKDNLLLLNKGEVGAGVTKGIAGLEIDRGTEPNYQIIFDESDNRFKAGEIGDIQCLALRDGDDSMTGGMFTSWDSTTKRLKTTNIIPSDQKISFGDNGDIELKYSLSKMGEVLPATTPVLNIGRKGSNYPHIEFGLSSNHAVIYTDALNGIYLQNQVLGRTFKRALDNSEVLYHADIINNLTSGGTNKVLSAEQGKLLQNSITSIQGSYLPLSGGTMTGSIIFPNRKGIFGRLTDGTGNIKIAVVNANNNVEIGNSNTPLMLVSNSTDLTHYRDNNTYKIWDKFNLPDPARLGVDQTFTGLNTFTKKTIIGNTVSSQILLDPINEVKYRYVSTEASRGYTIALGNNNNIRKFTFGGYYSASKSDEYAYLSLPGQEWDTSTYKFYANSLRVPYQWSIDGPDGAAIIWSQTSEIVNLGRAAGTTKIRSGNTDLIHTKGSTEYIIWDKSNLPNPASTTDLTNYLPLIGGTLTGQLTIKQSVDIKLRLQSTDADNHCIIQAINAQASQLGVFGYAGDKWAIGHNGTYYEIWDKYNLTNPVTYTTDTYNYATLRNKDGQYFTYIKTGTNGLLPHSKATLVSGGSGSLGTSDQSFNAAYINNLHTNKVTFGDAGSFIDNQSGDSSHKGIGFYTSQNAACPVYVGSLCVSDGYANSAPNIPTNGIYSKGVIKSAAGFTSNFRQTNLNLAKTGNDVLYISSFTVDAAGSPGTDSNTGKSVNDGMFLTYFWVNDNAFQLAADIDGTGIAYRQYIPSSGNSTTGWKFLADTNWVVSKINSSTSNFLKKTGDTATGQIILDSNGIAFKANIWTNDLTPNRNYSGYLQVLDAYDAASAGGPTNYGTVLQINSRNSHWANQLWFPGGDEASKNGLYYRHMAYNQTEYSDWQKILTNKDVNIIPTQSASNPSSLPVNQIFYSEIQRVDGTPTVQGALFSVQGDDEGIQLWASSTRTELYYRTKWTSYGNWIKLATTSDLGNYLPLSGGTISSSKSNPLTINSTHVSQSSINFSRGGVNKGTVGFYESLGSFLQNVTGETLAVKSDGAYYGVNIDSLRKLATVTDLNNYLPLTGGNLTGKLSIKSSGSNLLILDSSSSTESVIHFLRSSTTKGAVGYYDNIGAFIYNFPSNTYLFVKDDGKPYVGTKTNYKKILTETDITGYATQSWAAEKFPNKTGAGASGTWGISISGNATTATTASKLGSTTIGGSAKPIYLSSGTPTACSATVGSTTVPVYMNAGTITQCSTTLGVSITGNAATATNATQLGGTAASSYVKANDNISRLTNDSGYTTQEWVNGQGFLTSDSILDKFVPTTGGYIRNSDQVLLRLQRTGVSTGTSRTIEMYFDDSNTDGTSTTPRGSIGYNSEVGMFLYSAKSKKFLAMEYTGRPFYGTPENRYYLLGSNTQYHNLDGYQRIGDIMIQWGYFSVQGNSTRAVNFPVSFTNTVWSVTGSWDNTTTGSQENWGFTDYTSSGFTIINGDGSSRVFHYIAIGPFTRS